VLRRPGMQQCWLCLFRLRAAVRVLLRDRNEFALLKSRVTVDPDIDRY
jgi:hypothetical protein